MKLLRTSKPELAGSFVFFDANVLGFLLSDGELFRDIVDEFKGATFCIDPVVAFEFLRDSGTLQQQARKEGLISNPQLFTRTEAQGDAFKKAAENALMLSNIFCFLKNKKRTKGKDGASVPEIGDLLLAGNAIRYKGAYILTCNKKDFPSPIFKIVHTYHYENDGNGSVMSVSLISFDSVEFDRLVQEFNEAKP